MDLQTIVFSGVLLVSVLISAFNGYRNGLMDGKVGMKRRDKVQLMYLTRMLFEMEGKSNTRGSRVVSEVRQYLEQDESTQWINSVKPRLRNMATREEKMFGGEGAPSSRIDQ